MQLQMRSLVYVPFQLLLLRVSVPQFIHKIQLQSLFFFLWLYSPSLFLGCLHETFRFISVTRPRTVSRTPWTGDQLVARPLLTAPGECDDGEVGGMNCFGRGNRSTRRKPAPTPFCPPQIPLVRPGREPGPPLWEASGLALQLWRGHSIADLRYHKSALSETLGFRTLSIVLVIKNKVKNHDVSETGSVSVLG
jgi:hypothetical protein